MACPQLQGWVCDTANPTLPIPIGDSTSVYVMVAGLGAPTEFSRAEFGIAYDSAQLRIDSWTGCGVSEAPSPGWPSSGTRIEEFFPAPQTADRVAVIGVFRVTVLGPIPWLLLGFNASADNYPLWSPAEIHLFDGLGFNVCESVQVQPQSWGAIKNLYR